MTPNHLELKSADGTKLNLEALYQIAPSCFTEVKDEKTGELRHVVNFTTLRQLLGDDAVEDANEMYQFTWPGKQEARREAARPISDTLHPCPEESVDWDTTQNLYIEGDNLAVLKLLQKGYMGKVKMIYIDPPYNTGNDFIYHDDFVSSQKEMDLFSGDVDEEGYRYRKNTDANGRFHSDWCSMIYSRLLIARSLLSEDGVIFISIDDNEKDNLKKICDEIFGGSNHQASVTYVRKTSGKQDSSNFMKSTEYILVYSKSDSWDCCPLIADANVTDRYNKSDEDGRRYRETDLRKTGSGDRREDRPLMWYPFYYNPETNELKVEETSNSRLINQGYVEILPIKPDGSEGRWRWGYTTASQNISYLVARVMPKYKSELKYTVYEKDYIDKKGEIRTVKEHTSWDRTEFNSDNAMAEFKNLGFSNQLFPYPKSSALMKHICYLANCSDGIILDFFSGSGTMAQGVMKLNAEDGGNRKFIMVQLPEVCEETSDAYKAGFHSIPDIAKERIRRAGKKIKEEAGILASSIDTGFRVFKLSESNFNEVYFSPKEFTQDLLSGLESNIKEGRTDLDLLFGAMLDWGVQLSLPMSKETVDGCDIYTVNEGDLVACFSENVTENVVAAMASKMPLRVLFRDSCFDEDKAKINIFELFKQKLDWGEDEAIKNIRVI